MVLVRELQAIKNPPAGAGGSEAVELSRRASARSSLLRIIIARRRGGGGARGTNGGKRPVHRDPYLILALNDQWLEWFAPQEDGIWFETLLNMPSTLLPSWMNAA